MNYKTSIKYENAGYQWAINDRWDKPKTPKKDLSPFIKTDINRECSNNKYPKENQKVKSGKTPQKCEQEAIASEFLKVKNLRETMDVRNSIMAKIAKYSTKDTRQNKQNESFSKIKQNKLDDRYRKSSINLSKQISPSTSKIMQKNQISQIQLQKQQTKTPWKSRKSAINISMNETKQLPSFSHFRPQATRKDINNKNSHSQTQLKLTNLELKKVESNGNNRFKSYQKSLNISEFALGRCKGEGRFGKVYLAIHRASGFLLGIKIIQKQALRNMEQQFVLQIKLQSFLNHPNIVKIYGWFSDKERIYILMEYMEEGSLYNLLKKDKKMSESVTAQLLGQVCKGVLEMHTNNIVHRDIKPQNIVMSNSVCKICDFGWAALCTSRRKTYCGTLDYVCPQILAGEDYDIFIDIWCLGILAYEMLSGKPPFYDISQRITKQNISECKYSIPENFSAEAKEFISLTIQKNSQNRVPISELLRHKFLSEEQ